MKLTPLLILIITSLASYAQQYMPVTSGDVKHDAEFTKNFTSLLDASKKGFPALTKRFVKFNDPDSLWALNNILPGTVSDSIYSDDNTITLVEHYHYDDLSSWNELVQKIKGSLATDFHYMVQCSDECGCQYIFTSDAATGTPPSYAGVILLNVDAPLIMLP